MRLLPESIPEYVSGSKKSPATTVYIRWYFQWISLIGAVL